MGGLIHIAEVAALLLVAYTLGWAIGFAARRATMRVPVTADIPAARLEPASPQTAAVVATALAIETVVPVAEPVVVEPNEPALPDVQGAPGALPLAPAIEPFPTQAVTPEPAMSQPAAPVATVPLAESLLPVGPPEIPSDEADEFVILGRPAIAAPSAPVEATPASAPGMAWAGQINGHVAPSRAGMTDGELGAPPGASVPPPDASIAEPAPSVEVAGTATAALDQPMAEPEPTSPVEPPPRPEPVEPAAEILMAGRAPAPAVVDHDAMFAQMFAASAAEPAADAAEPDAPEQDTNPEPSLEAPIAPEPVAPPVAEPPPMVAVSPSEDDAMRAIEGGWSRSRAATAPEKPELMDVAAAVAAAQSAVRQAIDLTGVPASTTTTHGFGKPAGLPRPHDGRRDNLREIEGVSPLDESTLNNLGIYHFEQVAEWTPQEVFWLENHVFARGRIGRESWQLKARDLMNRRPPPSRFARL